MIYCISSIGWKELALDLQGDSENPQELTVPKKNKEGSEQKAFHLGLQDSFLYSLSERAGGKGALLLFVSSTSWL